MRRVEIRLPEPTGKRLAAEAKAKGMSVSAYIRAPLVQPELPGLRAPVEALGMADGMKPPKKRTKRR